MSNNRRIIDMTTNFVIVFVLVMMCGLAFSYNTRYAMKVDSAMPIYEGDRNSNKVSLMFNVYWGTEYIDGILDVLDRYNIKATFFIGGTWAEKNGEKLKEIASRGHEIGNHGYFHKDHKKLDFAANCNEIEPCNRVIEGLIGLRPTLFAPPSGAYGDATIKAADKCGMTTIMWSKDTIDWRDKDTYTIIKRATKDVKGGELILAHPTKNTLEALPRILDYYRDNGLAQCKVSENINYTQNTAS